MASEPPAKRAATALGRVKDGLLEPTLHLAMMRGLVYADRDLQGDPSRATQCPVAMLPGKLPAKAFHDVVALSPLWNKLVDAVARDLDWLYKTLEAATAADPFTKRLVEVCKAVQTEGLRQPAYLGIHRSDYMLHEPGGKDACNPYFLQVELNTIASSMAAHAANASALHLYLLSRYSLGSNEMAQALREHFGLGTQGGSVPLGSLPENPTLRQIPAALASAHELYGARQGSGVLFIIQGGERNYADQRWLELELWQQHKVPVIRKTLAEVLTDASLDEATGRLSLDGGGFEVSTVYFRAGYSPDDYPSEAEWKARLLLERSLAIKCPSIAYQLVGAKKVQQALAGAGTVERFLDAKESSRLRASFAGLWGLGPGEDDAEIIGRVLADPALYVLKPQREGGGNNFYGQDAAAKLRELSLEERGAYILMQRILPQPQAAVLTRGGRAEVAECVSEYGFYSVFLGDGAKVYKTEHAGHLVRTKMEGVDEGGVAAGYAVISSPFLVL